MPLCVLPFVYIRSTTLASPAFLADRFHLGGCTAVALYLRRLSPAAADVALLPQKRPSVVLVVTCILKYHSFVFD